MGKENRVDFPARKKSSKKKAVPELTPEQLEAYRALNESFDKKSGRLTPSLRKHIRNELKPGGLLSEAEAIRKVKIGTGRVEKARKALDHSLQTLLRVEVGSEEEGVEMVRSLWLCSFLGMIGSDDRIEEMKAIFKEREGLEQRAGEILHGLRDFNPHFDSLKMRR